VAIDLLDLVGRRDCPNRHPPSSQDSRPGGSSAAQSSEASTEYLGVSRATIERLVFRGELPIVKVAGCTRYDVEDLNVYIAVNRVPESQADSLRIATVRVRVRGSLGAAYPSLAECGDTFWPPK
jgi:excisionase family DNA binding protein